MRRHKCVKELREYLPRTRATREQVHAVAAHDTLGALQLQPEAQGALPQPCELYSRVGCAAPSMDFLLASSGTDLKQWRERINDGSKNLNATLKLVRDNADKIEAYAMGTFLPSIIVGNVLALSVSGLLLRRLIIEFRLGVQRMRKGHPKGKNMLAVIKHNGITAIQIPKVVGLTLMSFLLNFWILSFLACFFAAVFFGPIGGWILQALGLEVLDIGSSLILEVVLVTAFFVVGLDHVVGNRILLNGTDEMVHPVLWTWYATVMIAFNLAKAAALATTRIAFMILLNICQVYDPAQHLSRSLPL